MKRQKGETYISSPDFLDVQAYVDTVCMHVKSADARKLMHFPEKLQKWLFLILLKSTIQNTCAEID